MTDWKIKYGDSPIYRLNYYIQYKLDDMEFINNEQYKTDLPDGEMAIPYFLPGQDLPEVTTVYDDSQYHNLSYCVYSVSDRLNEDEPYMMCGQVSYSFYHSDIDYLIGMKDYLSELLRREDWSASDINDFYRNDSTYPFEFKTITVLGTAGPAATDDEGGRNTMMVIVRYDVVYEGKNRDYNLNPGYSKELGMR